MLPPVSSLASVQPVQPLTFDRSGPATQAGEFKQVLQSAIHEVEKSGAAADQAVHGFLAGDDGELHSSVLATQKAELEFDMFLQVRNKVVSAYQEIMRMQI
jgi:flagellar hook-basal body complex protein FliE